MLNTIKIKADNILENQFHSELFLKHEELITFVSCSELTMNDKIILHYRDSSNRKIIERDKIDTPNTHIHDHLVSWLGLDKIQALQ